MNRQNRSHSRLPPRSACTKRIGSNGWGDECTTDSDFMSGPEGKTPSEIDEKIADYQRKVKESQMQAMHRRRMEGNALQDVFTTHVLTYATSQRRKKLLRRR